MNWLIEIAICSKDLALSYKFQMDVYFFEVYTHCEAPKLISNKFVIHPFCDFPKLKLTHREEFPSLGGHQKPLPAGWTSRISRWVDFIIGWNSKWVEFKMGRIQNGWPSFWEFHTGNNRSVNEQYRGICNWALLVRFSNLFALPRASGLGNLTRFSLLFWQREHYLKAILDPFQSRNWWQVIAVSRKPVSIQSNGKWWK